MTSLCTAGGVVPLILAFGAVVFFGVTIPVVLTLFLIPPTYALLARKSKSPEHISRLVRKLEEQAKTQSADPA
jgi:HAE1 family hydrophobic/amphiphilic exporter-1